MILARTMTEAAFPSRPRCSTAEAWSCPQVGRRFLWALALSWLLVVAGACPSTDAPANDAAGVVVGDGFAAAVVESERTVIVRFTEPLKDADLADAFSLDDFTRLPSESMGISVSLRASREVLLTTAAALVPGTRYTVTVRQVRTRSGRTLSGTINFTAVQGQLATTTARIVVPDVETARRHEGLTAWATVAVDGSFSEALVAWPLTDEGSALVATLPALVDSSRTVDRRDDDDDASDHRALGVVLLDAAGRLASALVPFVVQTSAPPDVLVDVFAPFEIVEPHNTDPLPPPPDDPAPDDGIKRVRVIVDDRAAGELRSPLLKASFTSEGRFDPSFPQTVALVPMSGDNAGFWETTLSVAVDAARTLTGDTDATYPYTTYLVEDGVPYEALSALVVAPDETPQTVRLSLGNPAWTPVTFRVDVERAYLNLSGSERGLRAGEAVFLTGEWQQAVDALGANCGDAFSGGEQMCLKMRPLQGHPGVMTRTVWLPPGRPYGWKVVRCDAAAGCGPLNALVSSSGRAFATVMKNLATDNVDAFADANVGIVDVRAPASTLAGGRIFDYADASVYAGNNEGSEPDPAFTPDGATLFKQEVPDLVVVVGQEPIKTRVIHVGTWRDVNLGVYPQDIIRDELSVDLALADYDDGFIGRYPPSREEP
jgi:hypothetical protein